MLFVISAPSGAGKTSIIRELYKIFTGLKFSVSATTRNKRNKEIDGRDYYFITPDEFKHKIENDEFVEWEEVYGNYYGTLKSELDKSAGSKEDMIFDVDVKGALSIKKLYPESVIFFIDVPINDLIIRLKNRGTESEEQVKKRAERISLEIAEKNKFDHIIDNKNQPGGLKRAVNEIAEIIKKYKK